MFFFLFLKFNNGNFSFFFFFLLACVIFVYGRYFLCIFFLFHHQSLFYIAHLQFCSLSLFFSQTPFGLLAVSGRCFMVNIAPILF